MPGAGADCCRNIRTLPPSLPPCLPYFQPPFSPERVRCFQVEVDEESSGNTPRLRSHSRGRTAILCGWPARMARTLAVDSRGGQISHLGAQILQSEFESGASSRR